MALKRQKRRRLMARRRAAPGAPPGTITVDPSALPTLMRVMTYGSGALEERTLADPAELPGLLGKHPVTWLDVDGLGNAEILGKLAAVFDLHPLLLEDVVNVHQRPKVEEYGKHHFVVVHQLQGRGATEQMSLVLGPNYLVTFQVTVGDCLDPVRERLRRSRGRLREAGADYLAYCVVDAVVDHYFPILDQVTDQLVGLEERIIQRPDPEALRQVYNLRHELLLLRRTVWPMREVIGHLQRGDVPLVTPDTRLYLRDTHDHCFQLLEVIDSGREIVSGLMDLYMSSVSQRMNEVMKVLTIISTIFIPLSFIASLYGMNFRSEASPWNMPELGWRFGYPLVLAVMGLAAALMLGWFWRAGWIGRAPVEAPPPEPPGANAESSTVPVSTVAPAVSASSVIRQRSPGEPPSAA